jgi:predicted N-acetyltransferase YhbS
MARKTTAKKAAKKTAKKAAKKTAKKAVKKAVKKAASKATKKAAKKATKKATKKTAGKAAAKPARKPASKATRKPASKPASKKAAAKKSPAKKPLAKKPAGKKPAVPAPRARRAPSRLSANRRAGARKPSSREALVVRAVSDAPKRAPRKPARKRPAKAPVPVAARVKGARPAKPGRAAKTARARIEARGAGKSASPLMGNARTPVTAQSKPGGRKAPFRLHALGLREEHPTDAPRVEMLLRAAQEAQAQNALSAEAMAHLRTQGEIAAALVAEYEDALVGHVVLVRTSAPGPEGERAAALLASLVVSETLAGLGVDAHLLSAALEQARAAGARVALARAGGAALSALGFAPLGDAAAQGGGDATHALELGEAEGEPGESEPQNAP